MRARSRDKSDRPTVRMPFLWYRGTRYVSVAVPHDPRLREAFERGQARDPDGHVPPRLPSWAPEQDRAFTAGIFSRRDQKDLRAPVAWPIQAVALLLRSAVQFGAVSIEKDRGRLLAAAFALPLYGALVKVEERLENREAARLGLAPKTAPRKKMDLSFTLLPLVFSAAARLRGYRVVEPTPPVALAQQIIAEIERRRSWRAALAAGRPPAQSGW